MADNDLITMESDEGAVTEFTEQPVEETPEQPVAEAAAPVAEVEQETAAEQEPEAVRGLKAEIIRTRAEAKQYREKAEAANFLAEQLRNRPDLIESLRTGKPLVAAPVVEQPAQPAARSQAETAALSSLAETLSLYTLDGKPDIDAAARIDAYSRETAKRIAEEAAQNAIKPFKQERITSKAQQMRAEAVEAAAQMGLEADFAAPIIDNLIGSNPEAASDPNNMSTALLVAAGLKYMQERQAKANQPAAPVATNQPAPPVYRENGNARGSSVPAMSALETQIARQVGAKPDAWMSAVQKLTDAGDSHKLIVMETD